MGEEGSVNQVSHAVPWQSPTIAVLASLVGGYYHGDLVEAIDKVVRQRGARLLALQTSKSWDLAPTDPPSYIPVSWSHIDAFIVSADALSASGVQSIVNSGKPMVAISSHNPTPHYAAVIPDNRGGTLAAVRHLLNHGHQRIGFVGWLEQDDMRQRYDAYRAALLERGITPDPALLYAAPDSLETGGQDAAARVIAAGMPCTAIMAATDLNAIGFMHAVQSAGYSVPRDIAIIGFDDIDTAELTEPPLSTVHLRVGALGAAAAEHILDALAGKPVLEGTIVIPTALVCRESCGCLGTARPAPWPATRAAGSRWSEQLAMRLAQRLMWPLLSAEATTPELVWPGVGAIVSALEAALRGRTTPQRAVFEAAWRAACLRTSSAETLDALFVLLEEAGRVRLRSDCLNNAIGRVRLSSFLAITRVCVLRSTGFSHVWARRAEAATLQRGHQVSLKMFQSDAGSAATLDWVRDTDLRRCCLALWAGDRRGGLGELVMQGSSGYDGAPYAIPGTRLDLRDFPPRAFLDACNDDGIPHTVLVLPVVTRERDWGLLAAVTPVEGQFHEAYDTLRVWTAQLCAALAREELVRVAEQQRNILQDHERVELERARATAARLEELNQQLAATDRLKTRLLEETHAQAVAAEELAQLRSDFVATVSHELRTPLTAILGYAELLKVYWAQLDEPARLDRIDRIVTAANRQVRLVDELLVLSRLEMGDLTLCIEPVALSTLIDRAAGEVRMSYRDQRIDLAGPAGLQVLVDADRTVQILVNILDNAAKYSPEGSSMSVGWERDDTHASVRVRDHGTGVSEVGLEHLFTRFGRVPGSQTRQGHVGTGLGLYLGRGFARAMGGELDLESTGPDGSVFCLTLQLA